MQSIGVGKFIQLAVLGSAACLVGCAAMYGGYGVSELKIDQNTAALKLKQALTIPASGANSTGMVNSVCFAIPVVAGNELMCQQQRNSAMATLLSASDDMCQDHIKTIYGNDATFNIVTGSFATLFAGAATVANVPTAKTTLSALSGFSSAERSLVNETVYKNMLVTAVTKKIHEARATKAAAIIPGQFSRSINEYSMASAVRDVVDYHYSCSFMYGLQKALEEGTNSGIEARKARLEQEKHTLELYVELKHRTAASGVNATDDPGIVGAKNRIRAIEAQLLNLTNADALAIAASAVNGTSNP